MLPLLVLVFDVGFGFDLVDVEEKKFASLVLDEVTDQVQ